MDEKWAEWNREINEVWNTEGHLCETQLSEFGCFQRGYLAACRKRQEEIERLKHDIGLLRRKTRRIGPGRVLR